MNETHSKHPGDVSNVWNEWKEVMKRTSNPSGLHSELLYNAPSLFLRVRWRPRGDIAEQKYKWVSGFHFQSVKGLGAPRDAENEKCKVGEFWQVAE